MQPKASARGRKRSGVYDEPDTKAGLIFWLTFGVAFAAQMPLFVAYLLADLAGGNSWLVETYLRVYAAPFAGLFAGERGLKGVGMVLFSAPLIGTTVYSAGLAFLVYLWWGRGRG